MGRRTRMPMGLRYQTRHGHRNTAAHANPFFKTAGALGLAQSNLANGSLGWRRLFLEALGIAADCAHFHAALRVHDAHAIVAAGADLADIDQRPVGGEIDDDRLGTANRCTTAGGNRSRWNDLFGPADD